MTRRSVLLPDAVFDAAVAIGLLTAQGEWAPEDPEDSGAAALHGAALRALVGRGPSRLDSEWARQLDRAIAEMLLSTEDGAPEPVHVIETLLRISAGIAVGTDRDRLWFLDYARAIYEEERAARTREPLPAVVAPAAASDGVLTIGFDGYRVLTPGR